MSNLGQKNMCFLHFPHFLLNSGKSGQNFFPRPYFFYLFIIAYHYLSKGNMYLHSQFSNNYVLYVYCNVLHIFGDFRKNSDFGSRVIFRGETWGQKVKKMLYDFFSICSNFFDFYFDTMLLYVKPFNFGLCFEKYYYTGTSY